MCGVAAMLAFGSCSTKSTEKAEEANAVEVELAEQADVSLAPVATDGKVIELDNASLVAPGVKVSQLTVLDFNAVWCGPCRQFAPAFHAAAEKFTGKADFISVDTDANPKTATAFAIRGIPTVVILMPDGSTKRFTGTSDILPAEKFDAIIAEVTK